MPSPGRITALRVPDGPGVRDDSGVEAGGEVPIYYDPLISKLVAWGADRAQAIARMQRALREYEVRGIQTTVPFFAWMLRQPAFVDATFHTGYLDELLQQRQGAPFLTAGSVLRGGRSDCRGTGRQLPTRAGSRRECGTTRRSAVAPGFSRKSSVAMEGVGAGRGPACVTFRFEVGGRIREVAARRVEQGFEVTLDGQMFLADLVRTGPGWSLLVGPAEAASPGTGDETAGTGFSRPMRSYEVAIEEQPGGATVHVDGHAVTIRANRAAARFGRRGSPAEPGGSGPRRIVAPMPGRVVKVLVKPGDAVDARQGLVVVEAMKMENELRAPGAGTVTEVQVVEGASVEANAVLVVMS